MRINLLRYIIKLVIARHMVYKRSAYGAHETGIINTTLELLAERYVILKMKKVHL